MKEQKYRYISPLTDFGFKKLFGTEPNKILTIDFLNQILPDRKVTDITYSSTEKMGLTKDARSAIFDLYCIGDKGERFIVEMQKAKQNFFKDRSVFYASFPIQEQAKKGDWNHKLDPVYFIGVLDFIFDGHKNNKDILHVVELKDQHCNVFYDKLKFIYLELPKFKREEEELETQFDKWLYAFTHLSELQKRPKKLEEPVFTRLFDVAEVEKFDIEERLEYEKSLKVYRDLYSIADTAEQKGMEKGIKKGKEEGIKEGMEKGIKKGKEEGIKEGMEKGIEKGIEKGRKEGIEQGMGKG